MWEEWCTRWGRDGKGKDRPCSCLLPKLCAGGESGWNRGMHVDTIQDLMLGQRAARGRGCVRRRDVPRSPPDSRCPPGKKVDTRDRPRLYNRKDSIFLIDFGLEEPRQGRVVDIAQEVF